jgi:DNA-binding Lrp family transcriptional regulator
MTLSPQTLHKHHKLSRKDFVLFAHLRQDARAPLTTISRKTGIPVSTLFDRLKATEGGLIQRHTSLLDFSKLGFAIRATLMLKVDKADREALQDYLKKHEAVNSAFRISQDYDFLVDAIFRQLPDVQQFIQLLEGKFDIKDTKLYYIIDEIARENFLADPQLLPE